VSSRAFALPYSLAGVVGFCALFLLRCLMTSFWPWRLDLPRFTVTTLGKC
jgi:hypothetical protein